MLKKMLLAAGCVAGICGICDGMQINTIDIHTINPSLPPRNRLAVLEYNVREAYGIPHKESTNAKEEKDLIDAFFKAGSYSLLEKKYVDTSECLLKLLDSPREVFHFSSRYEMGEFSSIAEYLAREKEICSYSEDKAKELDDLIERSSSEEESSL